MCDVLWICSGCLLDHRVLDVAADFHFHQWDERMLGKRLVFSSRSGHWRQGGLCNEIWCRHWFLTAECNRSCSALALRRQTERCLELPFVQDEDVSCGPRSCPPSWDGGAIGARLIPAHYPGPSQLSGTESPGATAPAVRAIQMFPVKSDGKSYKTLICSKRGIKRRFTLGVPQTVACWSASDPRQTGVGVTELPLRI